MLCCLQRGWRSASLYFPSWQQLWFGNSSFYVVANKNQEPVFPSPSNYTGKMQKWTFSWRLEELVPFIGLMWLFYPLPVIPLWDRVYAAGVVAQVGLCVVRAVSQPPAGFGFLAVHRATPPCVSSLQERRTCSAPATSVPTARMNHSGSLFLVPSLPRVPRALQYILQGFSVCSALPCSSVTLHTQLPGTVNGN